MKYLKAYINYLNYIIEHKKIIFKICWNQKLYIHAFTHDLSKLRPSEFFIYANYFYIDKEKYKNKFNKKVKLHYKRNKHHWNYWVNQDMPEKYVKQMISDWKAVAKKLNNSEKEYYLKNYHNIKVTRETRLIIENLLYLNITTISTEKYTLYEIINTPQLLNIWEFFINDLNKKLNMDIINLLKKSK